MDKIREYVDAGIWIPRAVKNAAPMLHIPKKDGKPRTPLDKRLMNANTVKDVTPLPDQDWIRNLVAQAKYVTKIDLVNAFEQVRVVPNDVVHTAFSTINGTYVSQVMQQGDCNAPSTFQRLMVYIFRSEIGVFLAVYLDDIFVFSMTLKDHLDHLRMVFRKLRDAKLYIHPSKIDPISPSIECLGYIIDSKGLHADMDKMSRIRNFPRPLNITGVQRFLGMTNYLSQFLPGLADFAAVLSGIRIKGPFEWRPIHEKAFESIKLLACRSASLVLKPIDPSHPDPIWVVTDASDSGIGAFYGQGPTWKTCKPAGFFSKKLTNAQRNYFTFEKETLAALEALVTWRDRLIGYPITMVTDHQAILFFENHSMRNSRHIRWNEYFQQFDLTFQYVKGDDNRFSDCLSRFFEGDSPLLTRPPEDFATADAVIDKEGDFLSVARKAELRLLTRAKARQLQEAVEPRTVEAQALGPKLSESDMTGEETRPAVLAESLGEGPPLPPIAEKAGFMESVRKGYPRDPLLSKILANPEAHKTFRVENDLIYGSNLTGESVLALPNTDWEGQTLPSSVIRTAHETLGHAGPLRTASYLRRWFWFPKLQSLVDRYCRSCATCATTKASNTKPTGLLHSLPIPRHPWQSIAMDFVGPFPKVDDFDYLWVILCRLTSMVHLVPCRTTTTAQELALLFLSNVVRLHGVPESIVSDRDSKFTSTFWSELHRLMGIKLLMSTAFHPQTDGASERMIRQVSQILRASVRPDQLDWAVHLPMVEFAINSATSKSTGFAPFELNYGYVPRTLHIESDSQFEGVTQFAENARRHLMAAHDGLIESRVNQTHFANAKRSSEPEFAVGDKVYLSTKNLDLPTGRTRRLMPLFIGPYEVLEAKPQTSNYKLDLPQAMIDRRIHATFHVSLLRPFVANDDSLFPERDVYHLYDFGSPDNDELVVTCILDHRWRGNKLSFLILWNDNDQTWESLNKCNRLEALGRYLQLKGVDSPHQLSRETSRL